MKKNMGFSSPRIFQFHLFSETRSYTTTSSRVASSNQRRKRRSQSLHHNRCSNTILCWISGPGARGRRVVGSCVENGDWGVRVRGFEWRIVAKKMMDVFLFLFRNGGLGNVGALSPDGILEMELNTLSETWCSVRADWFWISMKLRFYSNKHQTSQKKGCTSGPRNVFPKNHFEIIFNRICVVSFLRCSMLGGSPS